MKRALYDLHMHTAWSYDASADIDAYFQGARKFGVSCIAITDHHVIDALEEVRRVAVDYPEVRWIRAAELTVTTSFGSIDLLCYGLPAKTPSALQKVFNSYHQWQQECGAAISAGAVKIGIPYDDATRLELLKSYRPERVFPVQGATHVKYAHQRDFFIERGFVKDAEEYNSCMQSIREAVAHPPYPHVDDVIPAVKDVGGVVVIAHPYGYFKEYDLNRMDTLRKVCYLDGIECAHPRVPHEFTDLYRAYCQTNELVSTGGSDTHQTEDIENNFANHIGSPDWLGELLSLLESRRP